MKISIFTMAFFICAAARACPDLSGTWSCREKGGFLHTESFQIQRQNGIFTYFWHHTYDNSDDVVVADKVERITKTLTMGNYHWVFKGTDSCPAPNVLLRHEAGERTLKSHFDGKTVSDQTITLQSAETATMVSTSIDYDGHKTEDWNSTCTKNSSL